VKKKISLLKGYIVEQEEINPGIITYITILNDISYNGLANGYLDKSIYVYLVQAYLVT